MTGSRGSATLPRTKKSNVCTRGWKMRLTKAVEWWLSELKLSKAKGTVAVYESDLRQLAARSRPDHIAAFDAELCGGFLAEAQAAGMKRSTLHRKQSALSAFARWGVAKRIWLVSPMDELAKIPRPTHLPRPFSQEERDRLLALELPPYQRVVRALLFFTGLRVSALCVLKVGDLTLGGPDPHLRTLGKGAKVQIVQLHPEVRAVIEEYMTGRPELRLPDPLLRTDRRHAPRREQIEEMTKRWGLNADVPECSPHRFRHTFATGLLEAGVDIRVIRDALGHADLSTTQIYTQVSDAMLRREIWKLGWKA